MNKEYQKRIEEEQMKRVAEIQKSMENFGKEISGKITLYHGTSEKRLEQIMKEGLKPRGEEQSNWEEGIGKSRPDLVYLTNCYACYYASCASQEGDRPVVLKIEIDTDEFTLYPDEEFIFRTSFKSGEGLSPEKAIELYESIDPTEFWDDEDWKASLRFMGTVTTPNIPVENIVGYAIGEGTEFFMNCDPTISPINYRFMSGSYMSYLESLEYKPLVAQKIVRGTP